MRHRKLVKRMAMTGAFTWGGVHLRDRETWKPDAMWRISESDVDEWLDDPERNPNRDWAFEIAGYLMGDSPENDPQKGQA